MSLENLLGSNRNLFDTKGQANQVSWWTRGTREYQWTSTAKLQNNSLYISWTCIKLSSVFMKGHIGRSQIGMKDLLTDLGNFVPGAVGCGIRTLKWQKSSMWACKMKDCLRYSLIYVVSIAFNFTVHLEIAFYKCWKEKKIFLLKLAAVQVGESITHPTLLRTWLWEDPGSFQRKESVSVVLPSGATQAESRRVALPSMDL